MLVPPPSPPFVYFFSPPAFPLDGTRGWVSGWWTLKLKPASLCCGDGMDGACCHAVVLAVKGSSSGAVVLNHRQVGGSARVMLAPGAPSLEARLGAGEKPCRLAPPRAELNWLLLKKKQQSRAPHLRSCVHAMNVPRVPCNRRRSNNVSPSRVARYIFFFSKVFKCICSHHYPVVPLRDD